MSRGERLECYDTICGEVFYVADGGSDVVRAAIETHIRSSLEATIEPVEYHVETVDGREFHGFVRSSGS